MTFTNFPIPTAPFEQSTFLSAGSSTPRSLAGRFADIVNVMDFGALNNNTGDNSAAFANAAGHLNLNRGGVVFVPPGIYAFTAPFDIPRFAPGGGWTPTVDFYMSGAMLTTSSAISTFRRLPIDQNDAANVLQGTKIRFHGGLFNGTNVAGQKGIDLGATYTALVEDVFFQSLDVGLELAFCLGARVVGCHSIGCVSHDFVARCGDGKWSGAGTSNSQSNHTTFEGCRAYSANGAIANYKVAGSSGVSIRNCIAEGSNPTSSILFDGQGSPVVKSFTVDNFHCEHFPSDAIIKMTGAGGGVYRFQQVHSTTAHRFLNSSGLSSGIYAIRDTPYVESYFFNGPAFTLDAGGAASAILIENWGGGDRNVADGVWWSGGVTPGNLLYLGHEPAGNGFMVESGQLKQYYGAALVPNAANDAAAAIAGVPIGGTYRNGNALQIRIA